MKILFTIRTLLRAGAERLLVNLANELVKNDAFEVAIYTVHNGHDFKDILNEKVIVKGGDIKFHFSLYKKNSFENKNYIDFVNEFQPDIIHSHLHFGDLLAHSYFYKSAKYFSHQHNSDVPEYKKFNWKKIYSKRTITDYYEFLWIKSRFKKFKTKFIACSNGTQQLINDMIPFGETLLLPNAIPLPNLTYQNKEINDKIHLIWVGRFSNVKRPQYALEIAKELKDENINFLLTMAGTGPEYSSCEKLIEEYNLHDYVVLLGVVNEMEEIYNNANILLHTSIYEGLPMVFIESNSYGIPILTTDCMPNNEYITNNQNGWVIKNDTIEKFVNQIKKINKTDYELMSKDSIKVAKTFGIEEYTEKLINFYNS